MTTLNNPMRFSIDHDRRINIVEKLRHPDFTKKHVTDVEVDGDQLYVHWEVADA